MDSKSDDASDIDGVPAHMQALYHRPDDQWGTDDWRTLTLYLADQLKAAHQVAEAANNVAESAIKRADMYRRFLVMMNAALDTGLIRPGKPRGRPGRPKRKSDEFDAEAQALVDLANRIGAMRAAEQMAQEQLLSVGGRLPHNRQRYLGFKKTWTNKISKARRIDAERRLSQIHGETLAFIDALRNAGYGRRRRPKNP